MADHSVDIAREAEGRRSTEGKAADLTKRESAGRFTHETNAHVRAASAFLRELSSETRFGLLCQLANGEKTVSELCARLHLAQPTVSNRLKRLKRAGLIAQRQEGKHMYSFIADQRVLKIILVLHEMYCRRD